MEGSNTASIEIATLSNKELFFRTPYKGDSLILLFTRN